MAQSKEVQVVYQGLQTAPDMLLEIRSGIGALKAFLSAPRAAMSSGSPFMAAAIVAVGLELGVFILDAIQAIDDDIDTMRETLKNYQETDEASERDAGQISAQVCSGAVPVAPGTSSGTGAPMYTGGNGYRAPTGTNVRSY